MKNVNNEKKLNAIMREMALQTDENEKIRLRAEAILLAMENNDTSSPLYDNGTDLWMQVLAYTMEHYDPKNGPYTHYFRFVIAKREKDRFKDVLNRPIESLDAQKPSSSTGEEGIQIHETISNSNQCNKTNTADSERIEDSPEIRLMLAVADLTALVLNFAEYHKRDSEKTRLWYRLFFTEDITVIAKETGATYFHERDIFSAMKIPYLDFFMSRPCRRIVEICVTPMKPYEQIVPERAGHTEELPLKMNGYVFPADVSLSYLSRCEGIHAAGSERSSKWAKYKEERVLLD